MLLLIVIIIKATLAQRMTCNDMMDPFKVIPKNETIETSFILNCLQKINGNDLSRNNANVIWKFLVNHYEAVSNIPDEVLMNLRWVTTGVPAEDYANMTFTDIDVIENFGRDYNLTEEQLMALAERVKEEFSSKEPENYTAYDLKALRNILCAFNRSEIERIHPSEYKDAAEMIGKLKCKPPVMVGFAVLALKKEAFGPAEYWKDGVKEEIGLVAKYLPKKVLDKLGNK